MEKCCQCKVEQNKELMYVCRENNTITGYECSNQDACYKRSHPPPPDEYITFTIDRVKYKVNVTCCSESDICTHPVLINNLESRYLGIIEIKNLMLASDTKLHPHFNYYDNDDGDCNLGLFGSSDDDDDW